MTTNTQDHCLTRQHYKRLRWFFKAPAGNASLADNIDLHLAACGLIERVERFGGAVCFRITTPGTIELAAENQREIERRKPHHSLASRLARWLQEQGRATWENIEFIVETPAGRQAIRPDVFSLATTCNPARITPHVYEVKVSRRDFLADIAQPKKRAGYATIAERVFYAAPAGMISPDECPDGCGLVLEDGDTFVVARKAKRQPVQLGPAQFMNLILKPGIVPDLV